MHKNIEKFNSEITNRLSQGQEIIEAVVEYCKENDIEVEAMKEVLKKLPKIKQLLRIAGEKANLLKRTKRLEYA